jgi:hypothetical protein
MNISKEDQAAVSITYIGLPRQGGKNYFVYKIESF